MEKEGAAEEGGFVEGEIVLRKTGFGLVAGVFLQTLQSNLVVLVGICFPGDAGEAGVADIDGSNDPGRLAAVARMAFLGGFDGFFHASNEVFAGMAEFGLLSGSEQNPRERLG